MAHFSTYLSEISTGKSDDEVQVVSVTVATEKNLPMLTC